MKTVRNRMPWFYWPPLIHLGICLIGMLGYVFPPLAFLGILFSLLTIVDIPVSMVTVILAFSNHGMLAGTWAIVAGTLWWYLLCRTSAFLASKLQSKSHAQ